MANVLESVGLLKRIACWRIIKIGGTRSTGYYGIIFPCYECGCEERPRLL